MLIKAQEDHGTANFSERVPPKDKGGKIEPAIVTVQRGYRRAHKADVFQRHAVTRVKECLKRTTTRKGNRMSFGYRKQGDVTRGHHPNVRPPDTIPWLGVRGSVGRIVGELYPRSDGKLVTEVASQPSSPNALNHVLPKSCRRASIFFL
jgi:hypothetical protein